MSQLLIGRPDSRAGTARDARLALRFEGALFAHHSLAVVNRELAARLFARGHRIEFARNEPDRFVPDNTAFAALGAHVERTRLARPDVTIRHHWPPNFEPCAHGRLILIQPWEYGSLPRDWVAPLQRNVDEVWVPSNWVRNTYLAAGIDPRRVHVVPNGVDTRRFHPGAEAHPLVRSDKFKFLFVGGALPRKGVHILLEAWKRAFTSADSVMLVIKNFGSADVYQGQTLVDQVSRAAARSDSAEIVYRDDTLSDLEMPGLFTACDALVHPFLAEGFGLPIAEAMSAGLPVIVTNGGPAPDFCDDDTAFLIPARETRMNHAHVGDIQMLEKGIVFEPDVDALATLLRAVASDPDAARAKGRLARQKIRAAFTWDHAADRAQERLNATWIPREQQLAHTSSPRPEVLATPSTGAVRADADAPATSVPVLFGAAPFNWSGYARITRMLLPALEQRGVAVGLQAYASDPAFLKQQSPEFLTTWRALLARRAENSVHVAFHPPVGWDQYRFLSNARAQNPGSIAHVGFTMFETDRLPEGWAAELSRMDEVFVPCRFNVETFAFAGVPREKIRLFQPGLDLSGFKPGLQPYALAGEPAFTFLSVFQWTLRKGWDVLIESYLRAFSRKDAVRLVIRAYPGERKDPPLRVRIAEHLARLGAKPEDAPRIELVEEFVGESELPSLYAAADAFVLPTRGEGFGLPFLEAMAAGLPTIGTRYGGHLDFLDDEVGYLIDCDGLEPVHAEQTAENPYYAADQLWARPSVDHTARLMRTVFDDRDAARAKGRSARERAFSHWSAEKGAERFAALTRDLHARSTQRAPRATGESHMATPPVLWRGPLLDMSGYADEGRDLVLGLDAAGVRVRALPVQWGTPIALGPAAAERLARIASAILFEPAVAVQHGFGHDMKPVVGALANVGRTMFETDRAPTSWIAPLSRLDEIWVPSHWQLEGFARSGIERSKLRVIPGTVDAGRFERGADPLAIDGARGFNFLSIFDWSRRKGWDVLVRAFVESFAPEADVALVLKVHSSLGLKPEQIAAEMRAFIERDLGRTTDSIPTILLLTARIASTDLPRLYAAADAYVMPSRGEGWGRPLLEAMASGLPVIGTRFGGNLEFMDDETSLLVDADLVDVPADAVREQPLYAGHKWGEPRVEHLKEHLRRVFCDPAGTRAIAARGREQALSKFDARVVAREMVARVRELGAKQR
ncbi:MAG: glycosyltransferase family 4 protein [Planctomycetes bacterium]|nr:glycosyltransferase family 4 protein [Planctomycetota bacterium]